ncbi:MAG: hypothetical protein AAF802_18145 [Planctomycetota bacterium]
MIWLQPLLVTIELMGLSVLIALLGIPLAFCLSLTPPRSLVRRFCRGSLIASLATPMILHAAAWEATAGKFGWMTFSQAAAQTYSGLGGIYSGLVACAWIHGLYGIALVTLATHTAVGRVDAATIDQARLDGGPAWIWWRVALVIARPWVVTALLATALLAATEMTVVNVYSVRTIADEFYLYYAAAPSLASVMKVLVVPVAMGVALIACFVIPSRKTHQSRLLGASDSVDQSRCFRSRFDRVACGVAFATCVMLFVLPMVGIVIRAGQLVEVTPDGDGDVIVRWSITELAGVLLSAPSRFASEYTWTAVISFGTAVFCLPFAWIAASLARESRPFAMMGTFVTVTMFVIPGPVVGLLIVHLFSLPVPGFSQLYQQTVFPTVLGISMRAFPITYWILLAGYWGVDRETLETATLDFGWLRRRLQLDRVLLIRPILVAFFASALYAASDVPVTLPVLPPGVVTAGTRLFALLHSGARNQESALAFWYVMTCVLIGFCLTGRWKRADS